MTKTRLGIGFLALAAILAGGVHVAAEGEAAAWDAAKKDFYRDFGNPDIAVKRSALDRIAGLNHIDAAKFLLSIYAQLKMENDGIEKKHDAAVADLEKDLKYLRSAKSLQADEMAKKGQLEAELKVVGDDARKKIEANQQLLDSIAASLSKFSNPAAVAELRSRVLKSPDWTDRFAILHGLIASNAPGVGTICLDAAKDREVRVRMLALDGCLRFKVDAAVPLFVTACEDAEWQIRLIGIAGVELYKSKDGISAMVRQLKKEDGRLRDDISGALKRLTGMDFGYNADIWEKWWTENKEKWNGTPAGGVAAGGASKTGGGGPGGTTTEPPTFFGLKITSKKIVFCLDVSGSMLEPSEPPKDKVAPPVVNSGNGPAPEPWEPGLKGTKIDVLKHEFEKTITKMDSKISFNVIVYNDTHLVWKDKMQLATPGNKADAIDFVKKQPGTGSTNLGDALEAAFDLAGAGLKDKHYAALVDTIYIMSDGSPNAGKYPTPDDIIKKVKEWNELSKVIINTVGLGDPTNYNPSFLSRLSGMTGGVFVKR